MLGLPGGLVEVTKWLVGISGHFLDLGVHHVRLLSGGRDGMENGGRRRYFCDVETVGLDWRPLDGIGTVVDGESLIWRQCWVGVLEGTGETLATSNCYARRVCHTLHLTELSCVTAFQMFVIMAEGQSLCVARERVYRWNLYASVWSGPHRCYPLEAGPEDGCRKRDSARLEICQLVSE